MGPSRLWPVSDVHCKIQTRTLVREGALHEEASTCQTKEHVKSGHGPQRAARHQDMLADWPSVANLTPLQGSSVPCRSTDVVCGFMYARPPVYHRVEVPCENQQRISRVMESDHLAYGRSPRNKNAGDAWLAFLCWNKPWCRRSGMGSLGLVTDSHNINCHSQF
jgi:hypothetical protein